MPKNPDRPDHELPTPRPPVKPAHPIVEPDDPERPRPEREDEDPECVSCGERHLPQVMCPPHEVRRGTQNSRVVQRRLDALPGHLVPTDNWRDVIDALTDD